MSGQIFQDGKSSSSYSAKRGVGNKATQVLSLYDNVRVVSPDLKSTLTCDRFTYYGQQKRIHALGHVSISGTLSTVGTLDELWATADLKRTSTQDDLSKP